MNNNGYSIRPGVARPSTILVTELDTGAFMVQGYPTGVTAYVSAVHSRALRDALDAAYGRTGHAMDIPPIVRPRV